MSWRSFARSSTLRGNSFATIVASRWPLCVPLTLLAVSHVWTNWRQDAPYMDELFHVPQAQRMCSAFAKRSLAFEYDPSITTPPGTYLVPAMLGLASPYFCSTPGLRLISAVFVALSIPQFLSILERLRARHPLPVQVELRQISLGSSTRCLQDVEACLLALHPVFFFYANLFYTDPPAIFFFLLCFRLSLEGCPLPSALFGMLSASCRQTNAVLHGYIAFDELLDMMRHRRSFVRVARVAAPHALAGLLYLCFLRWNSFQVALGDQTHHPVSLHYAMFPYYTGYLAVFGVPLVFASGTFTPGRGQHTSFVQLVLRCARDQRWRALTLAGSSFLALLVAATGAYVHPFVLSDNRHYIFYVYRRFLLRNACLRFLGVPLYSVALLYPFVQIMWLVNRAEAGILKKGLPPDSLAELHSWKTIEAISDASLMVAVAACVVPATLLEPRYFAPGFLVAGLRAFSRESMSRPEALISLVALTACNVALLYVFCEMPFPRARDDHMPNDASPGRFLF
jgi:alpha-1,2-glucosyltransferase